MKNPFKKKDDPNRYVPVPREKYLSLGLNSPPENGFDDFLTLQWCRDTKDEKRQQKAAEKQSKSKKGGGGGGGGGDVKIEVERKYFLCLIGTYEPYRANDPPINLNKKGYHPLPKWTDEDYLDEILRNGYFFLNDEFILDHYPQAIRPANEYPYVEQYVKAYQHWNEGRKPTDDQKRNHKISSAIIVMQTIDKLEKAGESGNEETIQKMKDILESMDLDDEMRQECEAKK